MEVVTKRRSLFPALKTSNGSQARAVMSASGLQHRSEPEPDGVWPVSGETNHGRAGLTSIRLRRGEGGRNEAHFTSIKLVNRTASKRRRNKQLQSHTLKGEVRTRGLFSVLSVWQNQVRRQSGWATRPQELRPLWRGESTNNEEPSAVLVRSKVSRRAVLAGNHSMQTCGNTIVS